MKYSVGTILKPTSKALRKYPNDFSPEDRFQVTGKNKAVWFKTIKWIDPFSKKIYKAGEIIKAGDDNTNEIRLVQDSLVERV